jgi:hypothetical protein
MKLETEYLWVGVVMMWQKFVTYLKLQMMIMDGISVIERGQFYFIAYNG